MLSAFATRLAGVADAKAETSELAALVIDVLVLVLVLVPSCGDDAAAASGW